MVEEKEARMIARKMEYFGFRNNTYTREAKVLQARVETRRRTGEVVTSDELWEWIKERKPGWPELDRKKVFQRVRL